MLEVGGGKIRGAKDAAKNDTRGAAVLSNFPRLLACIFWSENSKCRRKMASILKEKNHLK